MCSFWSPLFFTNWTDTRCSLRMLIWIGGSVFEAPAATEIFRRPLVHPCFVVARVNWIHCAVMMRPGCSYLTVKACIRRVESRSACCPVSHVPGCFFFCASVLGLLWGIAMTCAQTTCLQHWPNNAKQSRADRLHKWMAMAYYAHRTQGEGALAGSLWTSVCSAWCWACPVCLLLVLPWPREKHT